MKKILIVANCFDGIYLFRRQLIEKLSELYDITICIPFDDRCSLLESDHIKFQYVKLERRGMNFFSDFKLLLRYNEIMKSIKPDLVITYTIKPNIYASMIAKRLKLKYFVNITGLGSIFQKENILKKMIVFLYRWALSESEKVFFENYSNAQEFLNLKIIDQRKIEILNGAGVDLNEFRFHEMNNENLIFLFIGRIMKDKVIIEFDQAANSIYVNNNNVQFIAIGETEKDFEETFNEMKKNSIVKYIGKVNDVKPYIEEASCIVLPSYHEGMSNSLLEAGSMGRPLIASNIPGCKEAIVDCETGYLVKKKDPKDLEDKMNKFINLSEQERKIMALRSHELIANNFNRDDVVKRTLEIIIER